MVALVTIGNERPNAISLVKDKNGYGAHCKNGRVHVSGKYLIGTELGQMPCSVIVQN